ncbi:MAG: tyrosine-type recombinase/integrase [Deltaproteobacteria bacterium]|nr:tyrosine-type recombinase/integrase [Deltaproteobacteria bacterium]
MKQEVSFTIKALEALPLPEGKRTYVHDARESGLLVQITPAGRKTFQLFKWYKTKPVRITLGTFPDMTIEQARKQAQQYKANMANGINPVDEKRKARTEMTFQELFEIYIDRHAKPRKRSWQDDLNNYRLHLKPLGKKRLSEIKKSHIASIHSKIGKKHKVTANRVLALVSSVFGRAIEYGLWEGVNPCLGIRKFPEKSRDRFLQADELPRFFKALNEEPNGTLRDYILISLLTGARRSNVLAMRWKELDLEQEGTWKIPVTKTGDSQTVTLTLEAIEILKTRKKETSSLFVFPGNGRTGHLVEPKAGWKRILERAGIKGLRIHDLRRTLGSWQAITGSSLPIIGKSLNHKNASTTQIYARLNLDPVRESVQKATVAMIKAGNRK